MTKDKRRLRAEAVERLKAINAATGMSRLDVIEALVPDAPRVSQDIHAALIDLLTDDEPRVSNLTWMYEKDREFRKWANVAAVKHTDGDTDEWLMSEHAGDCGHSADMSQKGGDCVRSGVENVRETPDFAEIPKKSPERRRECAPDDTREELEADVRYYLTDGGHEPMNSGEWKAVVRWLDRQAAITERECHHRIEDLSHDCEMWRDLSEDMRMERDELKRKYEKAWEYGDVWPRFDDGGYVEVGSEVTDSRGSAMKVGAVMFYADGYTLYHIAGRPERPYGHREKHPPVKAHDGQPIKIGQTLYGLSDGKAWEVVKLFHGEKYSVRAHNYDGEHGEDFASHCLKPEWLTHEQPDGLGRVARDLRKMSMDFASDVYKRDECGSLDDLAARIEKMAKAERP